MSKPLTIMIVDDDRMTLDVTAAVFTRAGHRVLTRASPIGTTVAIQRERPDVVLLDVNMPGLSGDRIAKLVRTGDPSAPILILYSGVGQLELEALARSCSAAGQIVKGGTPTELLREVERIVLSARMQALQRGRA